MSIPRTQFAIWLRTQLFGQEESCRKIIIRHATSNARIGHVLLSIDVPTNVDPDEMTWDEWVTNNIDMIEQIVQADADGSNTGVEKYAIQVYHGDDNRPSATFSVRMTSQAGDDDGLATEPASKNGHLAQMMRHVEAMMRMTIIGTGNTIKAQSAQIHKYESVVEKLLNEKFDNITTMEQLMSMQHERDLESAKAEHDMQVKDKLFDKAMILAPIVANKLLGEKALPEKTTATEQVFHSFAASLTEDQFKKLLTVLDADQQVALLEVINSTNTKQERLLQKPVDEESSE